MIADSLWVLLGLVLLYFGAEWLVRGSSSMALRLGLSPLVIGLTVVAYGTSMPELVVSVKAALAGQSDIAIGNVIGSNIFNIALILGVAAVIFPIKIQFQLIRFDVPLMIGATLLAMFFLRDGRLDRWEAGILFTGIILYTVGSLIYAKKSVTKEVSAEYEESMPKVTGTLWADLGFIVAGLGVMILGSRFLVDGSIGLARGFGVSEAVIGLTIVAAGTSTPELAATIVAALKKEADIAVGNIVGSNIYNLLCILGAAGLIHPLSVGGITMIDQLVMLGVAVLLLPFMWSGFVLKRWEGIVMLAIYFSYLVWLWPK
jgi:cation:H+ antiporter